MCSKTTAKYKINGQSFCYKYEYVQYMSRTMGYDEFEISNILKQSVVSIQMLLNYIPANGPGKGRGKRKSGSTKKSKIIEMYTNNPTWSYQRIADTAGSTFNYVSAVIPQYKKNNTHNILPVNAQPDKTTAINSSDLTRNDLKTLLLTAMRLREDTLINELTIAMYNGLNKDQKVNFKFLLNYMNLLK